MATSQLLLFPGAPTPQAKKPRSKKMPPLLVSVRVQPSDVWQMGRHRLLCGDATSVQDVARLTAGVTPRLAVHDPPYGNQRMLKALGSGTKYGRAAAHKGVFAPIRGNEKTFDPKHLLTSGEVVVLWGANHYANALPSSAAWLIWDKRGDMASNGFGDGELAWVSAGNTVRLIRHRWNGMIRDSERGEPRVHPTQKPVVVLAWIIDYYTAENEVVADYYLGSGTTLIACERTGRACYGMEIEPQYCDIILARWERETGQQAILLDRQEVAA